METRNNRFELIRLHFQLSKVDFAKMLAFKENYIKLIVKGERGVSDNVIKKVGEVFPEINTEWLKLGRGEMLNVGGVLKSKQNSTQKELNILMEPAEHKTYNPIHTTQDDTEPYPTITTNAKKAFINYYEQMSLINKLMQSKQEEYQEVYEHLIK